MNKSPLLAAQGAAGATFVEADGWLTAARFGPVEAETAVLRAGAGVIDLASTAVFRFVGPDARRFCNGMFTNNVRALQPGQGNRNAMVDDRARMQGLLDLYCTAPEAFLAVLDGVTPEAFEARYAKYIIFDDVEMTHEEGLAALSVQGPRAEDVLRAAGLPIQEQVYAAVGDVHVARRDRTGRGGFDLVVPREALVATWEGLRGAGASPVGTEALEILRIEAGLPRWPVDMGEKALLHEMRLVASCGSFDKGCYIGQEVINRIDVMGQVTKKIWGLEMAEDAIPPHGAEVWLGEENVGTVLSGVREGRRVRTLALLRKAAWTEGAAVQVRAADRTVAATVRDLPFAP